MKRSESQTQTQPSSDSRVVRPKRRRNNPDESCRTCRLRKVKCSGRSGNGPCTNCLRLKLNCGFIQQTNGPLDRGVPNNTITEAGTLRKRAQRACLQCHSHKTKCSGDLPTCARCLSNDLSCEYRESKRKFANVTAQTNGVEGQTLPNLTVLGSDQIIAEIGSDGTGSSTVDIVFDPSPGPQAQLIKRDIVLKHVDAYFDHFFHMPCMGFLHPTTVYRWIEEDNFPPHLAAAICSIASSLVSTVSLGRSLAARWNAQVEYYVFQNLDRLEPDLLLYHVLVTIYNWMQGPWSKVWMYVSTAARLIRCLQLNYDPDCKPTQMTFIQQEIQRRSVWQIYLIDHLLSGGYEDHLLLPSNSMHLRLPCSDQLFRDGLPSMMETLDRSSIVHSDPNDYSLDGFHVKVLTIRSQVLSATKRFTNASHNPQVEPMRPEKIMETVTHYQAALHRFNESLPERLKLSEKNVHGHLHRPDRPSYVMLHTWVCQTVMDLYRFSLPKPKDPSTQDFLNRIPQEFLVKSQQQAVAHAISLAQFWTYTLEMIQTHSTTVNKGIVTMDWMIGACAVEVVTVLLTARKYELFNVREGSSAQLCRGKDIDDVLLSTLASQIVSLLKTLVSSIPRIESYLEQCLDKVKQFEEDKARSATQSPISVGFLGLELPPGSNLPGPDNILPNGHLEASDMSGDNPYSTSISDKFLRKKNSLQNGVHIYPGAMDPPTIPFCLEQARNGPFTQPTTQHTPEHSQYPEFNGPPLPSNGMNPLMSMGPIENTARPAMRPAMGSASTPSTHMVLQNYPDFRENAHFQMHTPALMSQDETKLFGTYAPPIVSPVVFQNGVSQYLWPSNPQRSSHV